jgi:hypothetical protein
LKRVLRRADGQVEQAVELTSAPVESNFWAGWSDWAWLGSAVADGAWVGLAALALATLVGAIVAGPSLLTAWRRARIRAQPFPPAWRAILRARMPGFARLPADLQLRLKKHVQVLLAEKPIILLSSVNRSARRLASA